MVALILVVVFLTGKCHKKVFIIKSTNNKKNVFVLSVTPKTSKLLSLGNVLLNI